MCRSATTKTMQDCACKCVGANPGENKKGSKWHRGGCIRSCGRLHPDLADAATATPRPLDRKPMRAKIASPVASVCQFGFDFLATVVFLPASSSMLI